jgi:RNA 3'-terminal phosphate cyclase (ATP)
MITLDGSQGEGGGQILRTALALSAVTGTPFEITGIRARRAKPGLMRQHLVSVRAAAAVCGAQVTGGELGSTVLRFVPGPVRGGTYPFDIGSAGSTLLVAQTILPPLLRAGQESAVTLVGGTHNPFAPSFPFVEGAFLPLLDRMGFLCGLRLEKAGFYPAGGGQCLLDVGSRQGRAPLVLESVPATPRIGARVCVVGLDLEIAQREMAALGDEFALDPQSTVIDRCPGAIGIGNTVHVTVDLDGYSEVFTAHGERGVPAEAVAANAAAQAKTFLASGAAVGEHLADQLLLPMALAAGGSFTTHVLSAHTQTQIRVMETFVGNCVRTETCGPGLYRVHVQAV